jgi:phosphoglycerate dehydrogenase-like enzyme
MAANPRSKPRILIPTRSVPSRNSLPDLLTERGCEVITYPPAEPDALLAELPTTDILVTSPAVRTRVDASLIDRAPRLRAVNSMVIGIEMIDVPDCTTAGIVVGNGAVAENYLGVAEATVMLMVALSLQLKAKERVTRAGAGRLASTRASLLRERTIGLIGLGRIGRGVCERLQGWDVRLLVHDPYVRQEDAPAGAVLTSLPDLLRESDIVSVHVALTRESRGMLGAAELALMKPTAYLINTARGGVVDEQALAEALNQERLAGAAIDTWATEPVSPDHPLFSVDPDRTILTGHAIGHSARLQDDLVEAAVENITRELRGELPLYVVNPDVAPRWQARLASIDETYKFAPNGTEHTVNVSPASTRDLG